MRQIDSLIKINIPKVTTDYISFCRSNVHPKTKKSYYYFLKCDGSFVVIQLHKNRIFFSKEYELESFSFTLENVDKIISDTLLILEDRFSDEPYITFTMNYNDNFFCHSINYRKIVKSSITEEWLRLLERDLLKILEADTPAVILTRKKNIKSKDILNILTQCCGSG
jgi:hypothetical protein